MLGVSLVTGSAKTLSRAKDSLGNWPRFAELTFPACIGGALKKTSVLFLAITTLTAAGGSTETLRPLHDQAVSRFNVYFNNDVMTNGKTVCDVVFPVPRSSPYTSNTTVAALEVLFHGPTPDERSQGYRSFFSEKTTGLLKRLKIEARTAYVDLYGGYEELAGVTSSCGSAEFFSQIQRTLGEFPAIDRIIYAIEGDPEVFYNWMELECDMSNNNCDPAPFAAP